MVVNSPLFNLGILRDNTTLKNLINENPEVPILFLKKEDSYKDEYEYNVAESVHCYIGEVLDYEIAFNPYCGPIVYTDRSYFKEELEDYLFYEHEHEDVNLNILLEEELKKYEPHWKKCLIIEVS